MPIPDLAAVKTYLGDSSATDAEIQGALAAEQAAQARSCRIPNTYFPDDLAEALMRRVAVNLALRALPLGVQVSLTDAAAATARVGGGDAEVRRLESPYKRLVVG